MIVGQCIAKRGIVTTNYLRIVHSVNSTIKFIYVFYGQSELFVVYSSQDTSPLITPKEEVAKIIVKQEKNGIEPTVKCNKSKKTSKKPPKSK